MRVVCFETDGHFRDVVRSLQATAGWEVVYLTGAIPPGDQEIVELSNCVFHNTLFARRGLDPEGRPLSGLPAPCTTLLANLAECESQAIQIMDRMDPDGRQFTHRERLQYYYSLVAQWDQILSRYRPDLAVWALSPHLAYDFVAYSLCKERSIPTVMFERTALPARMLRMSDFTRGSEDLRRHLVGMSGRRVSYEELESQTQQELVSLQSQGKDATSARMRINTRSKFSPTGVGATHRLLHALRNDLRILTQRVRAFGLGNSAPLNSLKVRDRSIQASRMNYVTWLVWRIRGYLLKEAMRREYCAVEEPPVFERPYVFLGLHCQPERMTSPLGGRFTDQHLWVRTIASHLPEGWEVVVKEHPWQLEPRSRGHLARWRGYYRQMAELDRVRLVPIETSTPDLIDGAKAVVALSGSVGFQAVVRGRPVIACGDAWYQDMPGVKHATTADQIDAALDAVRQGFRVDMKAVFAYLKAVEEASVRMWLEPDNEPTGDVSAEECLANTAASLVDYVTTLNHAQRSGAVRRA